MEYLNHYCWCGTVKQFVALECDEWLGKMEQNYRRVTPHQLTMQQRRAWKNSFFVLKNSLTLLGEDYENLHMIFEYCLPMYPPKADGSISGQYVIRADCILVSKKAVVVLEFKDLPYAIKPHGFSARRYRNRLQKYHDQSFGKRKWAILVPTLSEGLQEVILQRISACAPDRLADELRLRLGHKPKRVKSIVAWRESTYSNRR